MRNWLASALIFGSVIAFGLASAHAGGGKGKKGQATASFAKRDKNGDGFLSRQEFEGKNKKAGAKAGARFDKLDKDKDGKISRSEIQGVAKKKKKTA